MGDKTGIQWTEATWNPLVGCTRVSPGCEHCYAEQLAATRLAHTERYAGLAHMTKGGPRWTGEVRTLPEVLDQPLRWQKPRMIFVNSMSDLFHEKVPFDFIDQVFAVMSLAAQHTFQVLTKRPARMLDYLTQHAAGGRHIYAAGQEIKMPRGQHKPGTSWPFRNIWLGVSVEDQRRANERIPLLLKTPAAVRFLSCEPLLGPVRLRDEWLRCPGGAEYGRGFNRTTVHAGCCSKWRGIDWVIVGGESGAGARPMHPNWARSLRDQCVPASVAFFFKQWGEWLPAELRTGDELQTAKRMRTSLAGDGKTMAVGTWLQMGKKAAGRFLDGRTWDEMPRVAHA